MPKLFTKFTTKSFQGTGLGLFISKSTIEDHGGKIWAQNNEGGKGSTFSFTLHFLLKKREQRSIVNVAHLPLLTKDYLIGWVTHLDMTYHHRQKNIHCDYFLNGMAKMMAVGRLHKTPSLPLSLFAKYV